MKNEYTDLMYDYYKKNGKGGLSMDQAKEMAKSHLKR